MPACGTGIADHRDSLKTDLGIGHPLGIIHQIRGQAAPEHIPRALCVRGQEFSQYPFDGHPLLRLPPLNH